MNNTSDPDSIFVMITAFFVNPYTIAIGILIALGIIVASIGALIGFAIA